MGGASCKCNAKVAREVLDAGLQLAGDVSTILGAPNDVKDVIDTIDEIVDVIPSDKDISTRLS